MKGRAVVIGLAAAAIVVAAIVSFGSGKHHHGGGSGAKPASNAVRISFVYSPEKQALLQPLIERFNRERHDSGGRPVFVDASVVASGDAETKIAKQKLKPVAWSPASSLWG